MISFFYKECEMEIIDGEEFNINILKQKITCLEYRVSKDTRIRNQIRIAKYQEHVNYMIERYKLLLSISVAALGFVANLLLFYDKSFKTHMCLFISAGFFLLSSTSTLTAMCKNANRMKSKKKGVISVARINQCSMLFFTSGLYMLSVAIVCDYFCKHQHM